LFAGLWYADTHLVPPAAITSTPRPLPTRTPEPTPSPAAGSGPRAVVLLLDGAQAGRVNGYVADGTMPTLARLKAQGAMAQYALSVDPSLSAAADASLATGAYPAATGVVAGRFHRPGDDLNRAIDASSELEIGAETVWRTAMREARRTAAVCWPGTNLDSPATLADYTVTSGDVDAASAQHEVTLGEAQAWRAAPRSFSPLREGTFTITGNVPLATLYVLALDTTDNDTVDYDTVILSRSREAGAQSLRLRQGETAPFLVDEHIVSGAHLTLTHTGADTVTIFQSRVCYNRAQPSELVRQINKRFGFIPAGADAAALENGWITPEQFVAAVEMQSGWISDVTAFVLETYKPEVLFAAQSAADELQHEFLLVDPRQPGHSAELAAEYDGYVRRGYALADAAAGEVAGALDLSRGTLFVVSGHGMAPVHSQVYANSILGQAGLLAYVGGSGPQVNAARSKAVAYAAGGAAHIFINLSGREPGGIVASEDLPVVQDAIVAAFEQVTDEAGQPVFSRVLRHGDLARLGLDAANAGDVFVQAAPGYAVSDERQATIFGPAPYYGEHGFAADLPEMHGIFLAAGRGIRAEPALGPVHIVDLAPTLDRLLGLKSPTPRAGRALEEVLLP